MDQKRTATITLHASHNYGSMLQAFALQQVLFENGYENEILNFRTDRQKDMYAVFTKRKGLVYLAKNLTHLLWYVPLKRKQKKFERFLTQHLHCSSTEFCELDDLKKANLDYDVYISGSDQIWNPVPRDFDLAYFLPFVKQGKRISYAASSAATTLIRDDELREKIADCLGRYDAIGVREQNTRDMVYAVSGRESDVVVDPTLLLPSCRWDALLPAKGTAGDYIFFYSLFATPQEKEMVKRIAKMTGLKVIVSRFSNQHDVFNTFKKRYNTGPLEFLDLIRGAKLVVTSSFHGSAFSVIFHKPFFAINGRKDGRINTLLELTGLTDRALTEDEVGEKVGHAFDIDFGKADSSLQIEREKSIAWLLNSLS